MKDGARRKVRGLWTRNDSFYCQTTVKDAITGRSKVTKIRLDKATDVESAKLEAGKLRERIKGGESIHGKSGPKLGEYKEHYLTHALKKPTTLGSERSFLNNWCKFLGDDTRLGKITQQNILAFKVKLANEDYSSRTFNLHLICLRNLLKMAKAENLIKSILPTDDVTQMKVTHVERKLLTNEQIEMVCNEAITKHKRSGQMFADYIRLMAFSGGRKTEVLKLKWEDVDTANKCLIFRGENAKNSQTRRVTFNAKLEAHLNDMDARKGEGSKMLFGSYRTDNPIRSFNTIIRQIRKDLSMPFLTSHLLRHYFISMCVMAGIDYMTIAKWVGHQDGGILIGRVYGHLNAEHLTLMAKKLHF